MECNPCTTIGTNGAPGGGGGGLSPQNPISGSTTLGAGAAFNVNYGSIPANGNAIVIRAARLNLLRTDLAGQGTLQSFIATGMAIQNAVDGFLSIGNPAEIQGAYAPPFVFGAWGGVFPGSFGALLDLGAAPTVRISLVTPAAGTWLVTWYLEREALNGGVLL